MLHKDGIPTKEDIAKIMPSEERLAQGPVAVYECFQQIPCNPCEKVCPHAAVTVGEDINNIPSLDENKCTGCGDCVLSCPGQAIFVIDQTYNADFAVVKLPFEFVPVPAVGQYAIGLSRLGEELGWFEIAEVKESGAKNKTRLISIIVPRNLMMKIRNIKVGEYK